MSENLLTPSVIKLFGRVMNDVLFKYDPNTIIRGYNNLLRMQLYANGSSGAIIITGTVNPPNLNVISGLSSMSGLIPGMSVTAVDGSGAAIFDGADILQVGSGQIVVSAIAYNISAKTTVNLTITMMPQFARIYAFSFEGAYYPLPRPPIFLVHGAGLPINAPQITWSTFETAGVMGREWDFSASDNPNLKGLSDLRYWEYEKGDFSIRLDPDAGPFEQILLQMALRSGADRADRSGAGVSGAGVSGAGVSGAGVSGAGVSGAGVSGAGVSGAGVRR
jgi:hypothetical protein